MAWAAQTEWMDAQEFEAFARELPLEPDAPPPSRGTRDLIALVGGAAAPPRRRAV